MSAVLLTGGFGYIGSHTASLLAKKHINFFIYDDFSNCHENVVNKLESIINKQIDYLKGDIRDTNKLVEIIQNKNIKSIIHFAALKSVESSLTNPLEYYDVNVLGTLSILKAMQITGIRELLFSSSATVYGSPDYLPIDENHPLKAVNPYGQSKIVIEKVLSDLVNSNESWSISSLRYFNPIGAHSSGLIGDDPLLEDSGNLMPSIIKAIKRFGEILKIYGKDYDTPDGTGIRDYIHVMDLADAHLKALEFLRESKGLNVFNIGRGEGYSVLEIINTFERVTGQNIPRIFVDRRPGDISACFADPTKAKNKLGWAPKFDLNDMCLSSWQHSELKNLN